MSEESSGGGKPPFLPVPPAVGRPDREIDDSADDHAANAKAVGVDADFLDALEEEFANAPPVPAGSIRRYGPGGTLAVGGDAVAELMALGQASDAPGGTLQVEGNDEAEYIPLFGSSAADSKSGGDAPPAEEGALGAVLLAFNDDPVVPPPGGVDAEEVVISVGPVVEPEAVAVPAAKVPPKAALTPAADAPRPRAHTEIASPDDAVPAASPEAMGPRRMALLIGAALLLLLLGYALTRDKDGAAEPVAARADATQPAASGNDGASPELEQGAGAADNGGPEGGAQASGQDGGAQDGGAQDGGAQDGGAQDGGAQDESEGADPDGAGAAEDAVDETGSAAAQADGGSSGVADADSDIKVDDEDDDGGGQPTSLPASSAKPDPKREAEESMTAAELMAEAKKSLAARRYSDAYRQSGMAHRKQPSDDALSLRVEAACGMNNKTAAKSSFDQVGSSKTRRELRAKCRDRGMRLGL